VRAALTLLSGLWLALALPVRAADAPAAAWSAEVGAETGRLVLIWPAPTRATLVLAGGFALLRAERPLSAPSPDVTAQLSRWLLHATPLGDGAEVALRLRPGGTARLSQLHPRLAVIELGDIAAPIAQIPAPPRPIAAPATAPAVIEPAAGPARPIPIPRSRPRLEIAAPSILPAPVAAAIGPRPQIGAPTESPAQSRLGVKVSAQAHPGELELRFRWGRRVPAAVFERGRQLWVVFPGGDVTVAGWRSLDRPEVTAWLEPVASTGARGARVFRFRLPRPVRIEPHATASGWAIAVTPAGGEPHGAETAVPLRRLPEPGALVAETEGEVVQLRDPDSGERLGVLLAPAGGLRQRELARLVDLELLPSRQGLVWRPLADGIRATVAGGRLTITRPGGLRLSLVDAAAPIAERTVARDPAGGIDAKPAPPGNRSDNPVGHHEPLAPHMPPATAAAAPPAGKLGLAGLAELDVVGRQQERRRIIGDPRGLAGLPRARARLELARLYLADALGPEARTALEAIDDTDLALPAAGPLRTSKVALTGAEALAGRHDPALASLLDQALDGDAEIALWRAYAAARAARWQLATQEWGRSGGLPEGYPDPLRRRLGLELAATLVDHGDATEARALLAELGGIGLTGEDGARLSLLEGIARRRDGQHGEAEAAFAAARAQGDSDIATRAGFLLVFTQHDDGTLTPEAAIEAMGAERPRWRGHPWEMRMLTRLAELQAGAGRSAAAIETREEALARTADPVAASAARNELRSYLAARLADGAMSPLARLALYREHGELLDGDAAAARLRAGLAEAAATAGLTETAAALLDAAGPAPEAVGGKVTLASALAARGDVEGALRRLREAGRDETPPAAELRAELHARAALAAGDPARAAAALAASGSAAARALGREIASHRVDWQEVARTAGADLTATGDSTTLSPAQADAAIWLGLAQSRLGHVAEAAAVADRYAARLDDQQGAALLRLATLPAPSGKPAAGAAELAAAIRAELGSLSAPGASSAAVRTASVRSAPEG
jgi:hypothetical protein